MKTPNQLIAAGTHMYCPLCAKAQRINKEKYLPIQGTIVWPNRIEDFSGGHYDVDESFICNYHGNPEFNPDHNCKVNDCDS